MFLRQTPVARPIAAEPLALAWAAFDAVPPPDRRRPPPGGDSEAIAKHTERSTATVLEVAFRFVVQPLPGGALERTRRA